MEPRIGFVGCGEVGSIFSSELAAKNAQVLVTDALLEKPGGEELIRSRLGDERIGVVPLPELIASVDWVISTVTTQVAVQVARTCLRYLKPGQVFLDLNSTSPHVKQEIAGLMAGAGIDFVEGAILGAVGATREATRVLLTGSRGEEVAAVLNGYGLNTAVFGSRYGDAASFKMLRSVFSKGIECLLLEMLVAGNKAGIEQALWEDIVSFMSKNPFEKVASNWIQTHAVAYERRYHEMNQVVETLKELGVEPILSEATEAFFERSTSLGFPEAFPKKPESAGAVVEFMARQRVGIVED